MDKRKHLYQMLLGKMYAHLQKNEIALLFAIITETNSKCFICALISLG